MPKLIELDDMRGDLHMHTTASDGKATLEEMVAAAQGRGLKYIAITDHSQRVTWPTASIAKRLLAAMGTKSTSSTRSSKRLHGAQRHRVSTFSKKAALDLPTTMLAEADWVIASVHYGQKQPREQITERILDALENPNVSTIAHPDRPADQPPQTVRSRSRRRLRCRQEAPEAAGAQRQPGPTRSGRRRLCRRRQRQAFPSSSPPTPTAPSAWTSSATASSKPAAAA